MNNILQKIWEFCLLSTRRTSDFLLVWPHSNQNQRNFNHINCTWTLVQMLNHSILRLFGTMPVQKQHTHRNWAIPRLTFDISCFTNLSNTGYETAVSIINAMATTGSVMTTQRDVLQNPIINIFCKIKHNHIKTCFYYKLLLWSTCEQVYSRIFLHGWLYFCDCIHCTVHQELGSSVPKLYHAVW